LSQCGLEMLPTKLSFRDSRSDATKSDGSALPSEHPTPQTVSEDIYLHAFLDTPLAEEIRSMLGLQLSVDTGDNVLRLGRSLS